MQGMPCNLFSRENMPRTRRYGVFLLSGAGAVLVTVQVFAAPRARAGAVALVHFFQLAGLLVQGYTVHIPPESGRAVWQSSCAAQSVISASLVPVVLALESSWARAVALVLGIAATATAVVGTRRSTPAPLVAAALAIAPGTSLVTALFVDRALPVWVHAAAPLVAFGTAALLPATGTPGLPHAPTVFLPLIIAGLAGGIAAERFDAPLLAGIAPLLAVCPGLHAKHVRQVHTRRWRCIRLREAMRASGPGYVLVPAPPGALLREFAAAAPVDARGTLCSATPLAWDDPGAGAALPAVALPGTELVFVPDEVDMPDKI